jgi:hypothetical protein
VKQQSNKSVKRKKKKKKKKKKKFIFFFFFLLKGNIKSRATAVSDLLKVWVNVAQSLTATQQYEWLSSLRRAASELLDACRALETHCGAPAPQLIDAIANAVRQAVRLVATECEAAVRRVIAAVKAIMLAVAAFSATSPGVRSDLKRLSVALGDSTKRFAASTDDILLAAAVGVALPTAQLRAIVAELLHDASLASDGIDAARALIEPLRLALIDATKELLRVVAGAAAVTSAERQVEPQSSAASKSTVTASGDRDDNDDNDDSDDDGDEDDDIEQPDTVLRLTPPPRPIEVPLDASPPPVAVVVEPEPSLPEPVPQEQHIDVEPIAVARAPSPPPPPVIDDAPALFSPGVDVALPGALGAPVTVEETVQIEEQLLTSQPSLVILYEPVDDDDDDDDDDFDDNHDADSELLLALARHDQDAAAATAAAATAASAAAAVSARPTVVTAASPVEPADVPVISDDDDDGDLPEVPPSHAVVEAPPPVPPMPDVENAPPPAVPRSPAASLSRVTRSKKRSKPRKRNHYNAVLVSLADPDSSGLATAHATIERDGDDGVSARVAAADEYSAIESRRLSLMLEKAVAAAAEAEVSAAIESIDLIDNVSPRRARDVPRPRGPAPTPNLMSRDSDTMRRQRDKVETLRDKEEQIMQLQSALKMNKVEVARNREGGSSTAGPKHMLARVMNKLTRRDSPGNERDAQQQQCKSVLARPLEPPILPGDIDAVNHRSRIFWMKPMAGSKLFEDLFRLSRRVTLVERSTGALLFAATHHADKTPLELLGEIFAIIASRVEVSARASVIADAARGPSLAHAPPTSSAATLTIRRFVEKFVALDSPTMLVLRSIEQAMVTPIVMWLKRRTRVLSKDVTTPDGWTVTVLLPPQGVADAVAASPVALLKHELHPLTVAVTHERKERALIDSAREFFSLSQSAQFVVDPVSRSLQYVSVRFPSVLYDATAALPPVRDALAVLAEWNAHCALFGVPLDRVCDREGRAVPSVLAHMAAFLCDSTRTDDGLRTHGIFRQSAIRSEVQALVQRIDSGGIARIESSSIGMHVLAGVLVHWLRSLPDPVIPTRTHSAIFALWTAFRNAHGENAPAFRRDFGEVLRARTSQSHRQTLVFVIGLFKRVVEQHEHNMMDARNCAIILGPILLRPAPSVVEDEMALVTAIHCANGIVEFLLSSPLDLLQLAIGASTTSALKS